MNVEDVKVISGGTVFVNNFVHLVEGLISVI